MDRRGFIEALTARVGEGVVWCEVGVFSGELSRVILEVARPSMFYLVDSWRSGPCGTTYSQFDMDRLYAEVMGEFGGRCDVRVVRGVSPGIAGAVADNSIDVLYLDAGHSYESVRCDIEAWLPKVTSGGVFAGHDYTSVPGDPGLQARLAVDALFPGGPDILSDTDEVDWAVYL